MAHLQFPKLDMNSFRLVGYSDAALANNDDLTSQLGMIILLDEKHDNAIPTVCLRVTNPDVSQVPLYPLK